VERPHAQLFASLPRNANVLSSSHPDNALEKDLGVKIDPENILDHHVLQRQANLLVDLNHQRNEAFKKLAADWEIHKKSPEVVTAAHSDDHTSGEAYEALAGLGDGVVAHTMLEYFKDASGWWHELLHHQIHGEKSGSGTFRKDRLFKDWKTWFEHHDHDAAPKET
jgi:hypothetical protein